VSEQGSGWQTTDDPAPLLRAAAVGDQAAWRGLVDRYGRRVYALVRSRCGDAELAEEITQSVFATVASKLGGGGYTERGRFESWLFRVTMNRVRDHIRRSRHRPAMLDTDLAAPGPAAEADPPDASTLHRLREALGLLSDADREIVELRHHGGLSFRQIADVLNEPIGTLLARHHRALRKLRELIEAGAGSPKGVLP
jgi:RNA polymerase sigma-70 factor, ECF subfamily